jgi:hypothetical protein
VFGVDSKLPAIVHTQDMDDRAVPTGEVIEVLQMGTPVALSCASLEEVNKHDDAKVPIWMWNTRLKTQARIFLEGREWEATLAVLRTFSLSFWR